MGINIQSLIKTTPPWFRRGGEQNDIIQGVMGRLVRNLKGHPFPGWSTDVARHKVADILLPAILSQPGFKTAYHAEMSELNYGCRRTLLERRQISPCMAARRDGCHLIINRRQDTVVMLNEEEHLVIHSFAPGADFAELLNLLQRLPDALNDELNFASSRTRGYLTSLPGEAGEGIQLYTLLHLPALTLSNMLPQINRSIEKLQLNIAPFYPQLGEECGNLYVIYTHPVPTGAIEDLISHLTDVTQTLALRENQVRERLLALHQRGDTFPADKINRSYGLLRYSRAISLAEWADALSMLRLGVSYGFITSPVKNADELLNELTALHISGGDYPQGEDIPVRSHPRESTAPERARSFAIQTFLNHTTLHTAPGATPLTTPSV